MHSRYFSIAGVTIRIESEHPIIETTYQKKFLSFAVNESCDDTVLIRHHFGIPDDLFQDTGIELYRNAPWAVSKTEDSYIYRGISVNPEDLSLHQVACCSFDHSLTEIYNNRVYEQMWLSGELHSLTMFPTDQILIARFLVDRKAFYLHSAGAIVNGAGMLFVGHSEAGKSTTTNFLIEAGSSSRFEVEILCDDRNIVRRYHDSWRVYGTWSHGDVPLVSSGSAPLKSICFIEKADVNRIELMDDRNEVARRLLACLVKPFVTADWWAKTLDHVAVLVSEVPCYRMQFDKSGTIVEEIARIANG